VLLEKNVFAMVAQTVVSYFNKLEAKNPATNYAQVKTDIANRQREYTIKFGRMTEIQQNLKTEVPKLPPDNIYRQILEIKQETSDTS
jgi:hypothetical protein